MAALPDSRRLFFEVLAHTGLRISEQVGLTWQYLELGEPPYRGARTGLSGQAPEAQEQGGAARGIPLSPGMAAKLLEHRRDTFRGPEAPVFRSPTGAAISPQNLGRDVLRPAREAVALDWVTFHSFRHTCASLLFKAGRNIKQVAEWLGHSDPSFTLRTYVSLMDGGVGEADFLDKVVGLPEFSPKLEEIAA